MGPPGRLLPGPTRGMPHHAHRRPLAPAAQLFACASGVYLVGTERHFSPDNNLVISKMLDDKGASKR